MDIEWLCDRIRSNDYEFTEHAEEERQADKILIGEIEAAILNGEIIEYYPKDPRGESCLVLGFGNEGSPVHLVCGKTKSGGLRVITVYVPTLPKWTDPKTRR